MTPPSSAWSTPSSLVSLLCLLQIVLKLAYRVFSVVEDCSSSKDLKVELYLLDWFLSSDEEALRLLLVAVSSSEDDSLLRLVENLLLIIIFCNLKLVVLGNNLLIVNKSVQLNLKIVVDSALKLVIF